jgi:hypothetical protein
MVNTTCVHCGSLYDNDSFDSCPSCEEEFDDSLEGKPVEEKMAERLVDTVFEKPQRQQLQEFSDGLKESLENEPDYFEEEE